MEQEELKLAPYARAIWRRKWLIVLTTLGALAAGLGASFLDSSEPEPEARFSAATTVRIEDQAPTERTSAVTALQLLAGDDTQSVQTHIEVIQSSVVMGAASNMIREASGFPPETDPTLLAEAASLLAVDVRVRQVSGSNLIIVSAVAPDSDTARLRTESIVTSYQQLLRDQKLVATQAAIDAIDSRIQESSQPELTSTRLKIVVEQLSTVDLDRVERTLSSSISQMSSLDLSLLAEPPSLHGLVSELEAASAHLETASIGLATLESDIESGSGSLAAVLGQESVTTVQGLTAASLVTVQSIRDSFIDASLAADINAGIAEIANTNATLGAAAGQIGTLSSNLGVPADNRAVLSQLRAQILALRDSNQTASGNAQTALNAGTASDADRRRLLTQMSSAASSIGATITSLRQVAATQINSSALTQMVSVEGQLQTAVNEFTSTVSDITANSTGGPASDLGQLENLLVVGLESLDSITEKLADTSSGNQLLISELDGVATVLQSAATLAATLRADNRLRIVPSSADIVSLEPQLNTGANLLNDVSASLTAGPSLTNQILIDRVREAKRVVDTGLADMTLLKTTLSELDLTSPAEPVLLALDAASLDLTDLAVSTRGAGQLMDATASAGVSSILAARLSRFSNDLSVASGIFTSSASRVDDAATTIRNMPEIMIGAALADLESARTDLSVAKSETDALQSRASTGGLLTLADVSEVDARLQLVQVALTDAVSDISQIPSAELGLAVQNLGSAGSRLGTVSSQISDIETAETAALDDLFEVRRELQIAVLGPQETGVALVDTNVNEIATGDDSALPVDAGALVAAFGGLILGLVGALVLEFMDRTVRRSEDITDIARVPNLGMLPKGLAKGNPHPPEVTDNPTSVFSEAVQLVTTQIQGRVNDRSRVLLISSPRPREGKTMMAINLARALSLRSLKVLLVDANFRKPDASKIFEFEDEPGLATALTQDRDPEEFIKCVEEGRLYVLPAGRSLVPPVELISRPSISAMLERARQQYDFVIIDGPPTIGFAESNTLAKQAGAVIMVTRAGVTKKTSLREAMENLSGSETLGVVINLVRPKDLAHLEHRDYVGRPGRGRWRLRLPSPPRFSRN